MTHRFEMHVVDIVGTVEDMRPALKEMYEFAQFAGFKGGFDEYIKENPNLPRLTVKFDEVVQIPDGGSIGMVAIDSDSPEAATLRHGQKVNCSLIPGPAGYPSRLAEIKPI